VAVGVGVGVGVGSVTGGGVALPVGVDAPPPQCARARAAAPHSTIRSVPSTRFRAVFLVFVLVMDLLVSDRMLEVAPYFRQVIDYQRFIQRERSSLLVRSSSLNVQRCRKSERPSTRLE
jgi:hypothetical protein